jgi:hypothetical protein
MHDSNADLDLRLGGVAATAFAHRLESTVLHSIRGAWDTSFRSEKFTVGPTLAFTQGVAPGRVSASEANKCCAAC